MKVFALFIGTDSLGYVNGKVYLLKINNGNEITRKDGTGKCSYDSIAAFLRNWKVL